MSKKIKITLIIVISFLIMGIIFGITFYVLRNNSEVVDGEYDETNIGVTLSLTEEVWGWRPEWQDVTLIPIPTHTRHQLEVGESIVLNSYEDEVVITLVEIKTERCNSKFWRKEFCKGKYL